jgi:hypothetical protein
LTPPRGGTALSPLAVVGRVLTVTPQPRLSPRKTLADLVEAAVRVRRGALSAIGRRLRGTAAKHAIQRAWRSRADDRVHASDVLPAVVRRLARRRDQPLLVALGWTEVGPFHTPTAAAARKGRAAPLRWARYTTGQLDRSRNGLEEGLLRLPVTTPPPGARGILLADRGFGRAESARTCQAPRPRFPTRARPAVRVARPSYTGRPDEYPIRKGVWRVLAGAEYRSDQAVRLDVVIRWKRGPPARRDEPWFRMTDLGGKAVRLTDPYARRRAVEELFRDGKDGRHGPGLGPTRVTTAARRGRLIPVLAPALILLTGLGLVARGRFRPGAWGGSNDPAECSDVAVGRRMWDRIHEPPERLIDEVARATLTAVGNRG